MHGTRASLARMTLLGLVLVAAGCREPGDSPAATPVPADGVEHASDLGGVGTAPPAAKDAAPGSAAPEALLIELVEADKAEYERTLARHAGQVVLVDFWATWCVPCKTRFPKLLDYRRQYADQGLALVSVSLDDSSNREAVLAFLKAARADIDNLISKWGAGTESMDQFQIDSAVPFYKLYDRQGRLRYQFSAIPDGLDDVEPLEQIEPRVRELLK